MFEGGFGLDWHRSVAREYEKLNPNIRVNLWGDPRVDEKIRPRILRGSPPDLASCSLPIWKLIVAEKLVPLDAALDSPAYGQGRTWRQTLAPGITADFQHEGQVYALPAARGAWVCWYDARMFRKHGWKPPETWDEFMALCDKIKKAGVHPIAFQGKYPNYAWYTLQCIYQRLVPFDQWYEMQDLKPGAFVQPDFVRAAEMLQEMSKAYHQPGSAAMSHMESQIEWASGRAALVFCGLWLKNEIKASTPDGFEMACFPVPSVLGGKGDQKAIYSGGGENFVVFSEGKRSTEAADFLKFMISMESARKYVGMLDTLSPVLGSEQGVDISPALKSAVAAIEKSSRSFNDRLSTLYLGFSKGPLTALMGDLVNGRISPKEFGQKMEAAAESVRKDPEVYKPPARGVPWANQPQ